jgi:hypothetical protein
MVAADGLDYSRLYEYRFKDVDQAPGLRVWTVSGGYGW